MTDNNSTEKSKILEYAVLSITETLSGGGSASTETKKRLTMLKNQLGMSHAEIMNEAIMSSGFSAPSESGRLLPNWNRKKGR